MDWREAHSICDSPIPLPLQSVSRERRGSSVCDSPFSTSQTITEEKPNKNHVTRLLARGRGIKTNLIKPSRLAADLVDSRESETPVAMDSPVPYSWKVRDIAYETVEEINTDGNNSPTTGLNDSLVSAVNRWSMQDSSNIFNGNELEVSATVKESKMVNEERCNIRGNYEGKFKDNDEGINNHSNEEGDNMERTVDRKESLEILQLDDLEEFDIEDFKIDAEWLIRRIDDGGEIEVESCLTNKLDFTDPKNSPTSKLNRSMSKSHKDPADESKFDKFIATTTDNSSNLESISSDEKKSTIPPPISPVNLKDDVCDDRKFDDNFLMIKDKCTLNLSRSPNSVFSPVSVGCHQDDEPTSGDEEPISKLINFERTFNVDEFDDTCVKKDENFSRSQNNRSLIPPLKTGVASTKLNGPMPWPMPSSVKLRPLSPSSAVLDEKLPVTDESSCNTSSNSMNDLSSILLSKDKNTFASNSSTITHLTTNVPDTSSTAVDSVEINKFLVASIPASPVSGSASTMMKSGQAIDSNYTEDISDATIKSIDINDFSPRNVLSSTNNNEVSSTNIFKIDTVKGSDEDTSIKPSKIRLKSSGIPPPKVGTTLFKPVKPMAINGLTSSLQKPSISSNLVPPASNESTFVNHQDQKPHTLPKLSKCHSKLPLLKKQ